MSEFLVVLNQHIIMQHSIIMVCSCSQIHRARIHQRDCHTILLSLSEHTETSIQCVYTSLSLSLQRAVVTISGEAQQNISRILNDVRLESLTDGHHVEQQQQGHSSSWFSDPAPGSATPGPSSSWGSEGACGVGQPTGQAASGSHPHLPMEGLQRLHQVHCCS